MSWKERVGEISKLAATVGVDAVLHQLEPPWEKLPWSPVISEILVALVSAAIVVIITNELFQRPRLTIQWRKDQHLHRSKIIVFEPVPSDASGTFGVSGTIEGRSAFAWILRSMHYYDELALRIKMLPADKIEVIADARLHARAGVVSGGLVRLDLRELPAGATASATFSWKLDAVPAGDSDDVKLDYEFLRRNQPVKWFDRRALKYDFAVERVQATRRP